MATTLELRRKIKTSQNISKTTRAMQMIAASRLKKSQHAAVSARPYVEKLIEVTQNISSKTQDESNPYNTPKTKNGKTLYVIISPDRGLCGGLITNLVREYLKIRHDDKAQFVTIGKKIEGTVAGGSKNLLASFPFGNSLPSFSQILPIIAIINEKYLSGEVESVKIISTKFTNVFSQSPHITQLLPVSLPEESSAQTTEFLFEPSMNELLPELLKRYIEMTLFQQMLESYASYNAAQMIAMQNATNNAKELVNDYQLLYNKARQEKITKEILDISSAAIALSQE
ncbi:MAG TPA: ATP synthase F1 subunit gamma [Patescibacteria group bacterium]|nr:ATP synthase F1 subunit gamma [Patescibacteria group bacterium]